MFIERTQNTTSLSQESDARFGKRPCGLNGASIGVDAGSIPDEESHYGGAYKECAKGILRSPE